VIDVSQWVSLGIGDHEAFAVLDEREGKREGPITSYHVLIMFTLIMIRQGLSMVPNEGGAGIASRETERQERRRWEVGGEE
jgi:hypothetical protein